ncbi:hypothetical protein F7F76_25225, partial [Escherichia coli]|uniref:hypothetical protein n=1 Tax=Escherichia coli TaxID=562 RepID=UPI0005CFBF1E
WEGWAILLRQKQKKLIMLPSETMIWQPEFTDKTLSRKPGAVHRASLRNSGECCLRGFLLVDTVFVM